MQDKKQKISVADFSLTDLPDDYYEDPYPYYHALRKQDPIHRFADGSYFFTRHADLFRIYRDPKLFSSDKKKMFKPLFGDTLLYEHHTTSLVFNDPPLHTHVRKAIGDALSQKTLVAMEPGLRKFTAGLLDRLEDKGEFDAMSDFATLIPVEVIGNLLRLPMRTAGCCSAGQTPYWARWNLACRKKNWNTGIAVWGNSWIISPNCGRPPKKPFR